MFVKKHLVAEHFFANGIFILIDVRIRPHG